jgi:hypothetical protein
MPVIIQNQLGNANWDDVVTGAFSVKVDSVNPPTAVANNYAHGIYFISADFHIQKNSLGSNEQTAKVD